VLTNNYVAGRKQDDCPEYSIFCRLMLHTLLGRPPHQDDVLTVRVLSRAPGC